MDNEGDGRAGSTDTISGHEPSSAAPRSSPLDDGASGTTTPNTRRGRNKRKRKRHPTTRPNDDDEVTTAPRGDGNFFNGLIVALSALESKHENLTDDIASAGSDSVAVDDPCRNYKTLKRLLLTHGATISPQVHKRVHYLISTERAVRNLTQRVRQARKRNVDVVDVSWVRDCRMTGTRLDIDKYLRNDLVKCLLAEKKERDEGYTRKICAGGSGDDVVHDMDDNAGWSKPVELDCCCVCHENGDDACPWCTGSQECNLTSARKMEAARTCAKHSE
jgi:hypothetical protein